MLVFIAWGTVRKNIRPVTCVGITAQIMEMHNNKQSSIITAWVMEMHKNKPSSIISARIMRCTRINRHIIIEVVGSIRILCIVFEPVLLSSS